MAVADLDPGVLERSYGMEVTGLSIAHVDGTYRFQWDPSYFNQEADAATESFRVSVTFPGEIRSHSGTASLEGTTVTWESVAELMADGGLVAVADDRPSLVTLLRNPMSWPVVLLLGLAVVVGVERFRHRGRHHPVAAPNADSVGPEPPAVLSPVPEADPAPTTEPVAFTAPQDWAPLAGDATPAKAPAPSPPATGQPAEPRSPWAPPE